MNKGLTTSVVPNVPTIIMSYGDLLIFTQCMLHFVFRFRIEIPLEINHICLNLVSHIDMRSLHLSTANIDDFVLPII